VRFGTQAMKMSTHRRSRWEQDATFDATVAREVGPSAKCLSEFFPIGGGG
jgi:hypothetical protein